MSFRNITLLLSTVNEMIKNNNILYTCPLLKRIPETSQWVFMSSMYGEFVETDGKDVF